MKCKNWSNKINNFVVRTLKAVKIKEPITALDIISEEQFRNEKRQKKLAFAAATAAAAAEAAEASSESGADVWNMPTMPIEKTPSVASLHEGNFAGLDIKGGLNTEMAAIAATSPTTSLARSETSSNSSSSSSSSSSSAGSNRSIGGVGHGGVRRQHFCGCGSISAQPTATATASATMMSSISDDDVDCGAMARLSSGSYMPSGSGVYASPLAIALAAAEKEKQEIAAAANACRSFCSTSSATSSTYSCNSNNNNNNTSNGNRTNAHAQPNRRHCNRQQQRMPITATAATTTTQQQQQQRWQQPANALVVTSATQQQPAATENRQQQKEATATATTTAASAPTPASTSTSAAAQPLKKSAQDFYFIKFLGDGSFSNVFLALCRYTKNKYAVKLCNKSLLIRENKKEFAGRERQALQMLAGAPGFVHLYVTFQDAEHLYFVTTYAPKGDLLPYINRNGSFEIDVVRHYAAELVLACEQMHRRNIVHRDLKPENILLDENMHTLVADFGSTKILTEAEAAQAKALLRANYAENSDYEDSDFDVEPNKKLTGRQQQQSDDDVDDDDDDDEDNAAVSGDVNGSVEEDKDNAEKNATATVVACKRRNGAAAAATAAATTTTTTTTTTTPATSASPPIAAPIERPTGGFRQRFRSFVGTAQYVSPEMLRYGPITPAADLWALGCIIYQMVAGLPPFRGANEFMIFKEVLANKPTFPEGFDKQAEDLVRSLLKLNPGRRLGAQDEFGYYKSIRAHPFFDGIDWEQLRSMPVPPMVYTSLPGLLPPQDTNKIDLENLKPGLDSKQMRRLLGAELGCDIGTPIIFNRNSNSNTNSNTNSNSNNGSACSSNNSSSNNYTTTPRKRSSKRENSFDLTLEEKQKRLLAQKSDKWHVFAENEVILKKGLVMKRKGLFARKRMLLLTTGPKLIYLDPVQMIKKGEIPFGPELRLDARNFKVFFAHTLDRTYYLEDPEGYALKWVTDIQKLHAIVYPKVHELAAAALAAENAAAAAANATAGGAAAKSKQTKGNSPTSKAKIGPKTSPKASPTTLKKKQLFGGGSGSAAATPTSTSSMLPTTT